MPTKEQVEVGSDILREEIDMMLKGETFGDRIRAAITDEKIRDVMTKVLTGVENVLGEKP